MFAGTVNSGEIKLFFSCIQVEEQFENCVMYFVRAAIRFINFIDNYNRVKIKLQCFL